MKTKIRIGYSPPIKQPRPPIKADLNQTLNLDPNKVNEIIQRTMKEDPWSMPTHKKPYAHRYYAEQIALNTYNIYEEKVDGLDQDCTEFVRADIHDKIVAELLNRIETLEDYIDTKNEFISKTTIENHALQTDLDRTMQEFVEYVNAVESVDEAYLEVIAELNETVENLDKQVEVAREQIRNIKAALGTT